MLDVSESRRTAAKLLELPESAAALSKRQPWSESIDFFLNKQTNKQTNKQISVDSLPFRCPFRSDADDDSDDSDDDVSRVLSFKSQLNFELINNNNLTKNNSNNM